jgi:hypothetical protein
MVSTSGALRLALVVAAVLPAVVAAAQAAPSRLDADSCKQNYDYAGAQDAGKQSGIRAKLSATKTPGVKKGFVAAWVGVGGPGLGPNGEDEWLQSGYVTFDDGSQEIYYEITLPGKAPAYHTVEANLKTSEQHLVSVLEVGGQPNSWRAWLDNQAKSPVYSLPKSHGTFDPQALAEMWNDGTTLCNAYGFQFTDIQMSSAPGGSWKLGKAGYVWQDSKNQVVKVSNDTFKARSTTAAFRARRTAPDEPPLLGSIARVLAGRAISIRCTGAGSQPGVLRLDPRVCETLLGYLLAQPYPPKAAASAGLAVAVEALVFLRAIGRVTGVQTTRGDCVAVGRFYRAVRELGATGDQALALREALLAHPAAASPRLDLGPNCKRP